MKPYHKIQTVWKRDEGGRIMPGEYADPVFRYLDPIVWEWSEKIDGTNIRLIRESGEWDIRGKTDKATIPTPLLDHLRDELAGEGADDGMTLYGEGYGWRIQKAGPRYSVEPRFILFDVRVGDYWLRREGVEEVGARMGFDVAPIVGCGSLSAACAWVREVRRQSLRCHTGRELEAEGLVMRPLERLHRADGSRVIAKIKAKDYHKLRASDGPT